MASVSNERLGPFQSYLRRHGLRHHYVRHRRRFSQPEALTRPPPPDPEDADPEHTSCILGQIYQKVHRDDEFSPKEVQAELVEEFKLRIAAEDKRAAHRVRKLNKGIRRDEFEAQRLRLKIRQYQRDTFEELVGYVDEHSDEYEVKIHKADKKVRKLEEKWTKWEGKARKRDKKALRKKGKAIRVYVRHDARLSELDTRIKNATRQAQVGVERKTTLRKHNRNHGVDLRFEAAELFKSLYGEHFEERKRKNEIKAGVCPFPAPIEDPVDPNQLNNALENYLSDNESPVPRSPQACRPSRKTVSFDLKSARESTLPSLPEQESEGSDFGFLTPSPSFRRKSEGSQIEKPWASPAAPRRKSSARRRTSLGSLFDNAARHVTEVIQGSLPPDKTEAVAGVVETVSPGSQSPNIVPKDELDLPKLPPKVVPKTPPPTVSNFRLSEGSIEGPTVEALINDKVTAAFSDVSQAIKDKVAETIDRKTSDLIEGSIARTLGKDLPPLSRRVSQNSSRRDTSAPISRVPSKADPPSDTAVADIPEIEGLPLPGSLEKGRDPTIRNPLAKAPVEVVTNCKVVPTRGSPSLNSIVTTSSTTTWLSKASASGAPPTRHRKPTETLREVLPTLTTDPTPTDRAAEVTSDNETEEVRVISRVASVLSTGTFGPSLPKSKSFKKSISEANLAAKVRKDSQKRTSDWVSASEPNLTQAADESEVNTAPSVTESPTSSSGSEVPAVSSPKEGKPADIPSQDDTADVEAPRSPEVNTADTPASGSPETSTAEIQAPGSPKENTDVQLSGSLKASTAEIQDPELSTGTEDAPTELPPKETVVAIDLDNSDAFSSSSSEDFPVGKIVIEEVKRFLDSASSISPRSSINPEASDSSSSSSSSDSDQEPSTQQPPDSTVPTRRLSTQQL